MCLSWTQYGRYAEANHAGTGYEVFLEQRGTFHLLMRVPQYGFPVRDFTAFRCFALFTAALFFALLSDSPLYNSAFPIRQCNRLWQ